MKYVRFFPLINAVIAFLPIISIIMIAFENAYQPWSDLFTIQRLRSIGNTVLLSAGVGLTVAIMGTSLAWLVTAYDFRSRQILKFALLLPMAIPTYIMAYAYLDLLHPLGPIQTTIRWLLGIDSPRDFRLPDIRNVQSAIVLLGCVLYPYVYISSRAMFLTLPSNLVESARGLGATSKSVFWRLALPYARPGIMAGIGIALLETINDVGASEFLGVRTATVELYATWISKSDLTSAARMATLLLILMLLFSIIEKISRHRIKYSQTKNARPIKPQTLSGSQAATAILLGWLPVVVGFVLPAGYLLSQVIQRAAFQHVLTQSLVSAGLSSLAISASVTIISIAIAVLVVWLMTRLNGSDKIRHYAQLIMNVTKIGYFLPGTVLAIGLLAPYAYVDHAYKSLCLYFGLVPDKLIMLGSIFGIITACTIRFMGMAVSNIDAGYQGISTRLDQASQSLGRSQLATLFRIHLPLLRPAMMSASLIVFVETMKELPTTLLLRPLNTETLATLLYADASRGSYEDGSTAALMIVMLGILPLIYLTKLQQNGRSKS